MLLPHIKEREYRFKLALRMVLPVFALVIAMILHTFITSSKSLTTLFYIESVSVLLISTYFIFYLIYKGFDDKITDNVSKVFTRDYLYKYLKKEILYNKEYTLILLNIDNLYDINKRYGLNNGDKVIFESVKWIDEYLKTKDIVNFPIGHLNGGNFIIGLKGNKNRYKTVLELLFIKGEEFKVGDIEVQISGAINDTSFSGELDFLIENLVELQSRYLESKTTADTNNENVDPSELEHEVITALKDKKFNIWTQDIFDREKAVFKECFIKLNTKENKVIHQKNYIKILDKFGMTGQYDLLILETVIDMCKKTEQNYAVSLSPTSLRNRNIFMKMKQILQKTDLGRERIIIFIQESDYYPKIDKFNDIIQELRESGAVICIDRVGSLHTSFLYLRDLDIDMVRFDSFYTKEIYENKYLNIIKGFVVMAHEKGVDTCIRMVEDEATCRKAKELGIDYIQGKYLSEVQKNYDLRRII